METNALRKPTTLIAISRKERLAWSNVIVYMEYLVAIMCGYDDNTKDAWVFELWNGPHLRYLRMRLLEYSVSNRPESHGKRDLKII